MGLRARLAVFFIAITVIPLTVAVLVLQVQLSRRVAEVNERELAAAGSAGTGAVNAVRDRAGDLATELGRNGNAAAMAEGDADAVQANVERAFEVVPGRADFVVVLDPQGSVLGQVVLPPDFDDGRFEAPSPDEIAAAVARTRPVAGALTEIRDVRGGAG
ncbi:MAG TPA: hypothetical protein VM307_03705, partial [Egibacteraceae bacterium]|nr:hypothetical protein [Egibacteraceae bacterium]